MAFLRYSFFTLNWFLFTFNFANSAPLAAAAQEASAEPVKVALLIHIAEFQPSAPVLKVPTENSLAVMRTALEKQGFQRQNIVTLSSKAATSKEVRRTFDLFIKTKVKQKTGAVVTILLDSHGMEIPDKNHDERILNPLDEFDEAFVCYDYRGIDAVNTVQPKGYILDDELAVYYDTILREIGPEGHLVVFTAGCHSATQTKGAAGKGKQLIPVIDHLASPLPAQEKSGKFICFASVENDATEISVYIKGKTSYLVHGISEALNDLTASSSYLELLTKAKRVIERDMAISDIGKNVTQLNIPEVFSSGLLEKVFRGYIRQSSYFEVVINGISETMKNLLPESFRQLRDNKKGGAIFLPGELNYVKAGIRDGLAAGQVVELTDGDGRSIAPATVIAVNDTGSLIQPDYPVSASVIKVRRPAMTISLYADKTLPVRIVNLIGNYMSIDDSPDKANLRLSKQNGRYQLCATGLPYTTDGCVSFTEEHTLLQKIRSLAVYQILKYKERRNGPIDVIYRLTNTLPIPVGVHLAAPCSVLVDRSSHLQIQISRKDNAARQVYYQHIDVLPDQTLDPHTLLPTGNLGRILSDLHISPGISHTPNLLLKGQQRQIDLSEFSPPFGLEENMLVYSYVPTKLKAVLDGHSPVSEELIDSIHYVDASYYYILPDRK